MPRADLLEKTLVMGKIEGGRRRGQRRRDGWMASLTQWTWVSANSGDSEGHAWKTDMLQFMGLQRVRHDSKRLDHFNYPKGHFLKEIWNRTINFIVSCGPPLTHFCSIKDHSPTGPLCLWLGSAQNEVVLLTIHRSLKSRASCVCFAWQVLAVQR